MGNLMSGSQHDSDARWAAHVQRMRGVYRSIYLFVPLIFIGAAAGAAVGPVWNGVLRTPAPHAIAIGLAVISFAAVAGAILLQWRNRLRSDALGLPKPRPNSKGALLLRELSRYEQHLTIVVNSFLIMVLSFVSSGGGKWGLFVLGPLICLCALALAKAFWPAHSAPKDEFFVATRAQAMQIGFWTSLAALSGLMAAAFFADVARFLPLALGTAIAVPCLSFVALSGRGGDHDE